MRILLAEDNPVNQMITKRIIEKLGTTVDVAPNGRAAVDMAKEQSYDLIFMDINMPIMNGIDAVKELRALGFSMPVAALTAESEAITAEISSSGVDELISKPVSLAQIEAVVNKYKKPSEACTEDNMEACINYVFTQLGLEKSIVVELLGEFISDSNLHVAMLRKAAGTNDISTMASEAHYIKGAAKNIGLVFIGDAAEEIEKNARRNNAIDYAAAVELLGSRIKNFTASYESYRK